MHDAKPDVGFEQEADKFISLAHLANVLDSAGVYMTGPDLEMLALGSFVNVKIFDSVVLCTTGNKLVLIGFASNAKGAIAAMEFCHVLFSLLHGILKHRQVLEEERERERRAAAEGGTAAEREIAYFYAKKKSDEVEFLLQEIAQDILTHDRCD